MGALKTILGIGLLGGALVLGRATAPNDVNGYSLQQQEQNTILHSEELGKGYQLTQMNDEVYMGNAEHLYKGLRAMTNYELVFGEIPFTGMFTPEETGIEKLIQKAEDLF